MKYEPKWIYINGEKTKYKIHPYGYVISTAYKGKKGCIHPLKHNHDVDGYCIITLNHKGHKYTRKIHRLVAEAFIPNPNNYPQVNHINGCKDINEVDNLEWVTTEMNIHHAMVNNLRKSSNTEASVRRVCELLQNTSYPISIISVITSVSFQNIIKIKNGVIWKSIGKNYDMSKREKLYHRGEENGFSHLSDDKVRLICELLEQGLSMSEISTKLNVPRHTIYSIKSKLTWKHISRYYNF